MATKTEESDSPLNPFPILLGIVAIVVSVLQYNVMKSQSEVAKSQKEFLAIQLELSRESNAVAAVSVKISTCSNRADSLWGRSDDAKPNSKESKFLKGSAILTDKKANLLVDCMISKQDSMYAKGIYECESYVEKQHPQGEKSTEKNDDRYANGKYFC